MLPNQKQHEGQSSVGEGGGSEWDCKKMYFGSLYCIASAALKHKLLLITVVYYIIICLKLNKPTVSWSFLFL